MGPGRRAEGKETAAEGFLLCDVEVETVEGSLLAFGVGEVEHGKFGLAIGADFKFVGCHSCWGLGFLKKFEEVDASPLLFVGGMFLQNGVDGDVDGGVASVDVGDQVVAVEVVALCGVGTWVEDDVVPLQRGEEGRLQMFGGDVGHPEEVGDEFAQYDSRGLGFHDADGTP